MIDIIEQELTNHSKDLLDILLFDRTTRKNICWATDYYTSYGVQYMPQEPITKELITGPNSHLLKPRVLRSLDEKNLRTKDKAEVFTPSWVCNEQNNLVDEAWFERKGVFNIANNKNQTWKATEEKIAFPKGKTWKKYVDAKRLEISCGEAPYLVSRYDTVTGNEIPISERIGLLDRKLRVINENIDTEDEWYKWAIRAYQSIYGYEYQGDIYIDAWHGARAAASAATAAISFRWRNVVIEYVGVERFRPSVNAASCHAGRPIGRSSPTTIHREQGGLSRS